MTFSETTEKYSFKVSSEQDLMQSFSAKDRKKIVIPKKISYPLDIKYYHAWSDPDGQYVYLLFKNPQWNGPKGLILKSGDKGSYRSTSRICDWCHAYGPSDQIGLLTMKPNSRTTIGMLLCLDLGCISRIEVLASITKKSFEKLSDQLCEKITTFFEKNVSDISK